MATYSTNLLEISLCQSNTDWSELPGYTSGSAPAATAENYIQDGIAVDQAQGQGIDQNAGIEYDDTTAFDAAWPAAGNWVVIGWSFYASPTNLKTWSIGGMRIGVGTTSGDLHMYNAMGNDFGNYPYGGWQSTALDPEYNATYGADQTIGTGADSTGTTIQFLGFLMNITAKIGKGSPLAVDAWRYGRGDIVVTGTGANFTGMTDANDATTARWGLFSLVGGAISWKGLMTLGESGTSITFSDSNKTIRIDDTPRVLPGFNKIEINDATSSVTWTGITFAGVLSPIDTTAVSPGDFEMVDNATVDFAGCVFSDMGTFIFDSNATVLTTSFRRCGLITVAGGTFTGCTFDDTTATRAVYAATGTEAGLISDSEFISGGTGYGLEVDGAVDDFILSDVTWTDYATQVGTTTDRAIHILATTGTVTITVSGGTTPSYHSDGATVIISDDVVNSVTVRDTAQVLIENCAVAVYLDSDESELANELTTATGKVTFSCPVSSAFAIRARKNSPGETRYFPATQTGNSGAAGVDLSMTLTEDTIAS